MAYADKKGGKLTGSFVGEAPKLGKKRRFKTLRDAQDYETFCKLMGREPPTIDEGTTSTGAPTFAQVAQMAKDAGGPKGKWKAGRDRSLMQRIDYCVGVIGSYEIQRVDLDVLDKITATLDRAKAPGKSHRLTNATKNRYLAAAGTVLSYAYRRRLIPQRPIIPLLPVTEKHRDILEPGQDAVVLKLMREAGHTLEALCVEVLIETGMRQGELQALAPDQIVVEENEEGSFGAVNLRAEQTKNNTARRVLFSADLARQIKAVVAAGTLPKGDKVLSTFKSAVEHAGIKGNLVIHSLRHTRNTRLRKAGVEKKVRMKLLGHKSELVSDRYDHVDDADQLEAVLKVRLNAGKSANPGEALPSQVLDFPRRGAG